MTIVHSQLGDGPYHGAGQSAKCVIANPEGGAAAWDQEGGAWGGRRQPAWVALGANLGRPEVTLGRAVRWLGALPGTEVAARSRWRRTAAWTPDGSNQPDYLNGIVRLQTSLAPLGLMRALLRMEAAAGRVRGQRYGPRVLDLDLVLMGPSGAYVRASPELTLPHPRLPERAFVLGPLAELDPDLRHPVLGRTVAELAAALHEVAPGAG